ncbi:apolipoprotein L domain-containing protein 1 [Ambystoma mexicanum]|uniref:apolipoprotein L domain-containing protein 1 n=1 Tax=Ambystoma mexicanum TaxID=8296 RepID=UPI0037E6FFEF
MGSARNSEETDESLTPLLPLNDAGPATSFLLHRRHRLRQHIARLRRIATRIERLRKGTRAASVAGSCLGAAGATAAVVGLSLSPITLGTSLLASAIGLAVAAAGGATNVVCDLSAALGSTRELKRVRGIARDSRQLVEEALVRLEILQREQGPTGGSGTISLSDCASFALLFGAHDFLVPEAPEAASKVGQAVLRAKTQRLAQTLEACTRALDAICQRLRVGDEEEHDGIQREFCSTIAGRNMSVVASGLWAGLRRESQMIVARKDSRTVASGLWNDGRQGWC